MPRKTISFELDFMIKDIISKFTVKQFDDVTFNITPLMNNVPYTTTNMTGVIYIGCDNDLFQQNADIVVSNNNINIKLNKTMLQNCGRAYAELELKDSNGTVTSSTFLFNIEKKIGEGSTIPGSIEGFVAKYERLIAEFKSQVKETINNCNTNVDNKLNTVDSLINVKISDFEERFNRLISSKQQDAEVIDARYSPNDSEQYPTLGHRLNHMDNKFKEVDSQLEHVAKHADIPTYNLAHITDDMGVTRGIQSVLDEISNTGIGRILLDRVYEIDEPLVIDRQNQNTNTSIEFYGGGCIKKSANFQGDQLVLLKIGFHDEDNIIFNNISFDGVDRTVNGIDTFENLNYNEECSDKSQHNESKFVKFYHCSFNNCYHGVRLSSLSWVFSGCLFEYNNYGVYLDCSANANTFLGCSIRRNIIGVKIKQFDTTIGTISNGFYNCTIESNQNLGIISKRSRNTKIIGNYFENNGYNIDANFEHSNNRKVHILMQDSGGVGQHTFDNFYNTSDFDIAGILVHSNIINPCKVELQLASNTTFINNKISNIKFIGFGAYTSDFYLNNERYLSTADTKVLYKPNEVIASNISSVDKKYYLTQTSNISSNSIDFCTLEINPIGIGMIININAILEGRTSAGNTVSLGVIKGSVIISKSTNNTEQYVAHVDDLKLINCNGALSGSGSTTNKLFSTSANITTTSNSNIITLKINGIDTSSMINWGPPVKVNKIISLKCEFINTAIQTHDYEFITIS